MPIYGKGSVMLTVTLRAAVPQIDEHQVTNVSTRELCVQHGLRKAALSYAPNLEEVLCMPSL